MHNSNVLQRCVY